MLDIQRSLDHAIARFESSDLAGIVELDQMIEINRLSKIYVLDHTNCN